MKILQKYYNTIISLVIVLSAIFIISYDKKENAVRIDNSKIVNMIYETAADTISPVSKNGFTGFPETVEQIMERNAAMKSDTIKWKIPSGNKERVNRENIPQNPESPDISRYPKSDLIAEPTDKSPQTVSTSFTAATLSGTNPTYSYPPDDMGAVGPTQFIVAVNGRIVSFNKSTGTADGVLNTTTDNFFNSVRNASGTSDPRIRYDRQTQKWFIVIINVSTPNRILISVSNSSTITAGTIWYYYYIAIEALVPNISNTCLADYPTLGIDNNALYIGTNNFCGSPSQTFNSTDGYVIRKSSISNGGTMVVTVFRELLNNSTYVGPYTPQGVDNFDAGSTEGYFVGVDGATYGTLMIRRVSTPGETPTISENISLTVPATSLPIDVRHKGNTGGSANYLDALDDRLFAAQMRNGKLWTSHNISVNNTGTTSGTKTRDACRWYEIQNLTTTPTLVQSGTVYDNATNDLNRRNYWIPTVNISGQGHVAMVFSQAGSYCYANVGTIGRLSSDALGTMRNPDTITASTTAYNAAYNRWGDYSYVSVDPNDDMTMWTVHQFCDATNSYGVRVTKLLAPPPAEITSISPATIPGGNTSFNLTINGTSLSGSGFYDPGTGFTNRLTASITGGVVVNSVTYVNPTQVILNLNTTNITNPTGIITITNPDGQFKTYNDVPLPVKLSSLNFEVLGMDVILKWKTAFEVNNSGFDVERKISEQGTVNSNQWIKIGYVNGQGTKNTPTTYAFEDRNLNTGKYMYRLKQVDVNGNYEYFELNGEVEIGVPKKYDISQNYPNPFNPVTKINFDLPENGLVNIRLYDMLGREVAVLVNEVRNAGYHTVQFDASKLSSGIYFYKMSVVDPTGRTGKFSGIKKLAVIK